MSDLKELNKQLSSLSQDFETHQQWIEVRQKQINDEKYIKMNNKWQQYQTFNTTQNTPYHQPQNPTQNPKLSNNNHQQQQQPKFTRLNNYQILHQPEKQQQDLRQDMNSRMDSFCFDSESNMTHSLVPVDMNHYYSGNLFMEGIPTPNNLSENVEHNNHNSGLKNQSRLLHQEKSKTLYRNDVNDRIAQFSPLGRTLHFPVNNHSNDTNDTNNSNNTNLPQKILTKTSRKKEMKSDINSRLSGYSPLSSNTPLQDNSNYSRNEISNHSTHSNNLNYNPNTNSNNNHNRNNNINRQQKIKFQEMMPVSST